MKVIAKVQTSIFLAHQYNCIKPWALTGADSNHFQHFLPCAWTSSSMGEGSLWKCSLKGLSSTTLISCFARLVQPSSPGCKENMSWYSAEKAWVAAWFASDYPSCPGDSSCWRSTSLFLSTDMLVHWIPYTSSSSSMVLGATSTRGTAFAATT